MDYVSEIAKQGLLGLLLAASLTLNFIFIKLLLAEKDKRITDAVTNRNDLVQPITQIADSQQRIEQKIRIAKGEI